jgi:hypothetical protein
MQQIVDHPESHYQGWWYRENVCGTVACFAGWACLLSGLELRNVGSSFVRDTLAGDRPVLDVATELLGLTPDEACALFDMRNNRHALELMVKDLVNGDELRDPYSLESL